MRILNDLLRAFRLGGLFAPPASQPAQSAKDAPSDDTFFKSQHTSTCIAPPQSGPTPAAARYQDALDGSLPAAHVNLPAIKIAQGTGSLQGLIHYFDIDETGVPTSTKNLILAGQTEEEPAFVQTLASLCNQLSNPRTQSQAVFYGRQGDQASGASAMTTASRELVFETLSRLGIRIALQDGDVVVTRKQIDRRRIDVVADNNLIPVYRGLRDVNTQYVCADGYWYAVKK